VLRCWVGFWMVGVRNIKLRLRVVVEGWGVTVLRCYGVTVLRCCGLEAWLLAGTIGLP